MAPRWTALAPLVLLLSLVIATAFVMVPVRAAVSGSTTNRDEVTKKEEVFPVTHSEDAPTLLLPSGASNDNDNDDSGTTIKLHVGGDAVKMEEMGPIIVNVDGTMRRISNWDILTQTEKEWSWRVIPERNKKRLAKLRAQMEEGGDQSAEAGSGGESA